MVRNDVSVPAPQGRGANIAMWVLQVLLALTFLMQGFSKLAGAAMAVELFDDIGAGDWFRYLVGTLEIAGAVGLLVPRLSGLAGLALAGLMAGAVATHLFVVGGSPAFPLTLLILAAVIAWGRRQRTTGLLPGR